MEQKNESIQCILHMTVLFRKKSVSFCHWQHSNSSYSSSHHWYCSELHCDLQKEHLQPERQKIKVYFISAFKTSPYPEEKLVKSQVEAISCMRKTLGLFQTGVGMREKAYGPARGGRVTGLYTTAGPRSGFTTGRPGAGIGRNGGRFCATKPRPQSDPEI